MPRNGSGTYSLPLSAVVPDTTILASWANTSLDDVALALTNSLAKNGETNPTANLPMNNFAHTGVAAATARTQYARAAEVIDGLLTRCTGVGGTADAITMAAALSTSVYVEGQRFSFTMGAAANTTAVTVNINGIGVKSLVKQGATALVAGDLPANARVLMEYDGTNFQLLSPFASRADAVSAVGISFAANDEIVWRGASVPAGWTNVSVNNSAIRIMTTPGADAGTVDFSTAFASQAVAGTNSNESGHTHSVTAAGTNSTEPAGPTAAAGGAAFTVSSSGHTHTFTGSAVTSGAGSSHTHTFSGTAINLAVRRHDMNVIRKS
jgi:hypothetical protein